MKPYSDLAKIIHREGYIFIIIFAVITFVLGSFSTTFGWIGTISTLWCAYFFRNPERVTPVNDNFIISPADGIVQAIKEVTPPSELGLGDDEMIRISIFLNVFNVHINRVPATGRILQLHYHPGKFFNASLEKASIHNERQSVLMETVNGVKIAFVQIAGLIARRIVCDLEESQTVKAGQRYGLIRFGSRTDIYLPLKTAILVSEGQTCVGGETVLADMDLSKSSQPKFEVR
ncbi:phosphatidylserine decarboxylase [Candidatus Megaera polyxenophila]|jgi:phosphatidylserine decarboxylase|uniref:phosphatidylserine decarboxylase n=1 Tax=Candidatus Megaera polyxenophila TaxID=988779 RepID=UPI00249ED4C1|nr:phosphatidylserine decarboxylase [Candidatus Megaera polyxenophila]BBB56093.1 phosphatidylserine decarboxylase [Candidatus Megaera polyxenophila]